MIPASNNDQVSEICPTCNSTFNGKYCGNCGEKVFHPSDLSFKKFISQTVDIFTHFDSKFIRSLKYLLFFPGYLPKAYISGQRIKYAKPMQIFILVNIFFYFVTHILSVSDYSPVIGDQHYFALSDHLIFKWAGGFDNWVERIINNLSAWKQHRMDLDNKAFEETFFENSWIYSKTFIVLLIPLYSIPLWFIFKRKFKYYGASVVFAIYL